MLSHRALTVCRGLFLWVGISSISSISRWDALLGMDAGMATVWEKLAVGKGVHAEGGQGTLEFALITAGLLAIVVGLGALWHLFGEGKVVSHALMAASHHVQLAITGAAGDVLLY